ncbi:ImmA/IrrE family metallo-endopeptidase [Kitasatospora misakiensis]|uniref:ImmA/IrrE family metallo-endopeptidase n=1 Tax=Kitasatospora misakiensis TaxID=67330 RepID=A0ABW0XC91_9ACTN
MAGNDRENLTPPATRAKCLIDKFSLEPPIDIQALIENKAELKWEEWPHECDAITILNRSRPLIIAHKSRPFLRQRFTLAHELGHVELAWHTNNVECNPERTADASSTSSSLVGAWDQEREANEFASHLLIPPTWMRKAVEGETFFEMARAREVLGHLSTARVSAIAGIIGLARVLLPGHAFFVGSSFAVSRGTAWPGDRPITSAARSEYLCGAHATWEITHQGVEVIWAQMHAPVEISNHTQGEPREASEILRQMILRAYPEDQARTITQSVNGVVGGLTGDVTRGWTAEAIASVVRDRISKNPKLARLVDDIDFPGFLAAKSVEVIRKRQNQRH